MKNSALWFLAILLFSVFGLAIKSLPANRQPTSSKKTEKRLSGEELISKSKELLNRIQDQKSKVILTLIEKDGSERKIVTWRYWRNYNRQNLFNSKTIIFTESPAEARNVGFLIWDYATEGKPDDLWLYLPTLRNTRRLTSRDQNDAFMGSDLTFGDMGQRRLDEDFHKNTGEGLERGVPSYIVESVPKEEESIYSKKIIWVSKKDYTIQKIDYYNKKGKLLKRQTIDWKIIKGNGNGTKNIYVWKNTNIENVRNGHKTIFEVKDLELNIGLEDSDFTERVLKTGKLRK